MEAATGMTKVDNRDHRVENATQCQQPPVLTKHLDHGAPPPCDTLYSVIALVRGGRAFIMGRALFADSFKLYLVVVPRVAAFGVEAQRQNLPVIRQC